MANAVETTKLATFVALERKASALTGEWFVLFGTSKPHMYAAALVSPMLSVPS